MRLDSANLMEHIKSRLFDSGADIVGIGDLSELPSGVRKNMPVGVSVAVKYPPDVIRGISHLPTREYNDWYNELNERLDALVTLGADALKELGYCAYGQSRAVVGNGENENETLLPHKTVATRAGLGWIGKSALLVTKEYGSMVRLSSILTDAPLKTDMPVNKSECGDCMICANACPAGAISGKKWEPGLYRDEFFDPVKCRRAARERAERGFGGGNTICGKCIEVCPYTQKLWRN